jgi:TIR domain-containing protein
MMATKQAPLHIFCGYAHEDEPLFHELKKALAILTWQEVIRIWHYRDLQPGAQWEYEIEREFNIADIILLLISPNFMASDYCYSKEMHWAITRRTTGAACVIPVLGKPTPGWETTPLSQLQALPTGLEPIISIPISCIEPLPFLFIFSLSITRYRFFLQYVSPGKLASDI